MPTFYELQAKFSASADGFLGKFNQIEDKLDNLPKVSEKATQKMSNSFDKVGKSLDNFDNELKKSGKSFDSKTLTTELNKAQKEFKETGNVSKVTMDNLNKEIKKVDFKSLPQEAKKSFREIEVATKQVGKQMEQINNVKFLEKLPADSRKAGAELLNIQKNIEKVSKSMNGVDDGFDMSKATKELDKVKRELLETGKVSEKAFNGLQAELKQTDFNGLTTSAQSSFRSINREVDQLEQNIKNVGNVKAVGGLNTDMAQSTKEVGRFKGALGGLGPVVAGAFAGASVVGFTKQLVESTAEINALSSQYEQVMGKMKGDTDKYLDEMSKKYNVHPNELKKSMLQYQAILKSKGLSEEDAYKTAKKWLERTVDGSSFANETMEESTARAMGIIKGEYDSADTIMINLSQTMLNDIAVDKYGKKWEKLSVTQQENIKIQESLRQHNKAGVFGQGVKEADSYERNVAKLQQTWKDFLATYGGPALSVANAGLKGGIKIVENLGKAFNGINKAIKDLSGGKSVNIMSKLGFSNAEANQISNWFNLLKKNLSIAGGEVRKFVNNGLNSIKSFLTGPDGQQLLQAVKNIFGGIATVVKVTFPIIKYIVKDVWDSIVGTIRGAMQIIKGIIQVFSGLFTGDFKKMWQGIKNIFFGAIKLIWNGVQLLFYGKLLKGAIGFAKLFAGGLKSMWTKIVGFFKSFGASIYKNINNVFLNMLKSVTKTFGSMATRLRGLAGNLVKALLNFFKNLFTGTIKIFTSLKNGIGKIWTLIKNASINAGKFVRDKVLGLFKGLQTGAIKIFNGLKNGISKSWETMKNLSKNAGSFIKNTVSKSFEGMHKTVSGWVGKVKKLVTGMKDSVVTSSQELAKGLKKYAIGGLNKMIDGINWVGDKLGMGKEMVKPIPYSTGTGGHPGGLATVGDKGPGNGKGTRELVQFPDGRIALFKKETTFDMPKGTHVYSNKETEPILKTVKYSKGKNDGSLSAQLERLKDGAKHKLYGVTAKASAKAFTNSSKLLGTEKTTKALKTTAKVGDSIEDIMKFAGNPAKLVDVILKKFGVDFSSVKALPKKILDSQFKKIKKGVANKFNEWFESQSGGDGDGRYIDLSHGVNFGFMPSVAQAIASGYPFPRRHLGLDIDYPYGTKVYSTVSGKATGSSGWNGGFGQNMWIKSGALDVIFGHLSKLAFSGTKQVNPGDYLGLSGGDPAKQGINAGSSSGAHLHYEMRKNGVAFDPTSWLKQNNGVRKGASGSVGNLRGTVVKALSMSGLPTSAGYVNAWLKQIQTESGGRANVVGGDDGLADGKAMGLVQVKPGTFRANALPGYNDIFRPLDNLIAGMRYAKTRYGGNMLSVIGRGHGYANGGFITKHHIAQVGEEGPETIIPHDPKRKARANYLLEKTDKIVNPEKYSAGTQKTHKVKYGDTLWDISRKNGTTVKFLQTLNNIKDHLIYPGQILKLTKSIDKLQSNVKKQTDAIKKPVKSAKPKTQTIKISRADELLRVATDLIKKGASNPDSKLSKENISLGKYMTNKMKNVGTQALNSLYKSVTDIIKKIDSTIKSNKTKVTTGTKKITSLSDKNVDAQYKLEQLYEEKKLNGATGYINVKTRLPDADTTLLNRQISTYKAKVDKSGLQVGKFKKAQEIALKRQKTAKNPLDRNKAKRESIIAKERLEAWKKQNAKELAQLKKFEQEKIKLQNRYKVTQKKVKGRSALAINKEIEKQKKTIASNKKMMSSAKSENKLYNGQIKTLTTLKKNEVLKADFLKKLYNQREALLKKMATLKEKEKALQEEKTSYKSGIVDNLQGYAGFGAVKGNTARDFVEFMKYRLGRVRKFSANMTKLKNMGLDPAILQEMIAGGIESAMPKAEVLIAGGSGYINQINALQKEVNKAVEWIANKQTNNVFDPQIANVQSEIKLNQAQQNSLNQQSRDYMNKKTTKKVTNTPTKKPSTVIGTAKKYVTKTVNKNYKVGKNDSLSSIAKKYGTTVEKLKQLNGLKSNTIKAGQTIKVPMKVQVEVEDKGTTTKKTTKTTTKNHAVKWGDTLGAIAKKYGTTVDEIKKYNGLKNDTIIAGRTLKIPIRTTVEEIVTVKTTTKQPTKTTTPKKPTAKKTTAKKKPTSHTIKAGESLGLIAQRYGITVSSLKSLNKLKSDLIHAGNKLKLPTNIKAYADGGIAIGRQLAWISEGGFAESIISHDPSKKKEQRQIWKKTGERLGFAGSDEQIQQQILAVLQDIRTINGEYSNKPTNVNVDAQAMARKLTPYISNQQAQDLKLKHRGITRNGR